LFTGNPVLASLEDNHPVVTGLPPESQPDYLIFNDEVLPVGLNSHGDSSIGYADKDSLAVSPIVDQIDLEEGYR